MSQLLVQLLTRALVFVGCHGCQGRVPSGAGHTDNSRVSLTAGPADVLYCAAYLAVASSCCASLDAKGGSLAGLADAGNDLQARGHTHVKSASQVVFRKIWHA
jgi:hypothetical protein